MTTYESFQDIFWEAAGCGCCTTSKSPTVEDVERWLRDRISKDILAEFDGDDVEVWLTQVLSRCSDIALGK